MTDDRWLDRVTSELRAYRPEAPALERRVMAAIAAPPRRQFGPRFGAAVLMMAAAAAVMIAVGRPRHSAQSERRGGAVEFSIEAPAASQVRLVGDFNDWDRGRTPLVRVAGSGRWRTAVPIRAGLYRYAFLVDGTRWVADPSQPGPAADPDFGQPVSLLTVP